MRQLNSTVIQAHCEYLSRQACTVHLFASLPSTNAWLLQQNIDAITPQLCVAETQTAGRGRRGKVWQSPPEGVTFSVLRRFQCSGAQLTALSLVAACAVLTALHALGVEGLKLKWPNDILYQSKKLCGLLVELKIVSGGAYTVTGIGLNYRGVGDSAGIEQAFIDLSQLLNKVLPNRNVLIATLAGAVLRAYTQYEQQGFAAFRAQWEQYDACFARDILLTQAGGQHINGIARGVADNGALKVETPSGMRAFYSGEISVRLRA